MMRTLSVPGTDLHISAIGLGTGAWGSSRSVEEAERIFQAYLLAGGNLFDTAHCYAFWLPGGDGQSERTLGQLIRRHGVRERVVVATKGGHCDAGPAYPRPRQCLSPDLLRRDVDESLQRLGFEPIDLYFLHRDDGITPVAEVIDTLNDLVARGKLRYLAASNWSTPRIEAANEYAARRGLRGFCVSQVEWSLAALDEPLGADPVMRHLTAEDRQWHTRSRMPVLAYSSTAGGFFSGEGRGPAFDTPRNRARLQRARELSISLGCTPGQVALAWLLHPPFDVVPLTGTGNIAHLIENIQATSIRLTPAQVLWLENG